MNAIETKEQEAAAAPGGVNRNIVIFLIFTVFLTAMGLTIIMPVAPYIVQEYVGAEQLPAVVGWLTAAFAICQFIAAPGLGVLSDRFGRRPVLLICLLGSAVGYLVFGIGGALWVLFLGRIIDGLTGGDISILFAFVGDIAEPEQRGKLFGQIGATVGIGFIVGPVIGGFAANFGYSVPIFLAAGITLINLLWGYFMMPESLRQENRRETTSLADLNPILQIRNVFAITRLRPLLIVGLCYGFPFALFTTVLAVLVKDKLAWSPDGVGLLFLIIGGTDIVMQGILIGRLIPIFGEVKLAIAGLAAAILSYLLIGAVALVPSSALLLAGIFMFSFSSGLLEPSLGSLVAATAGPRQQGIVNGGNQAIRALTNIAGPLLAGTIYTQFGGASPYWLGAAILALGILALFVAMPTIVTEHKEAEAAA